jgi:hypothetical protein
MTNPPPAYQLVVDSNLIPAGLVVMTFVVGAKIPGTRLS